LPAVLTAERLTRLDSNRDRAHGLQHDRHAHHHHLLVFLGLPVKGGSTDHIVNKPPSGGFVVSNGT
jgi:hypothetical protein